MKHMFNTLVQPYVDYCCQFWAQPEGQHLDKVENVLRHVTSIRGLDYWQRLRNLKINLMHRR